MLQKVRFKYNVQGDEKMKRFFAVTFMLMLALVLVACGGSDDVDQGEVEEDVTESDEGAAEETDSDAGEDTAADVDFPTGPIELIVPHAAGGGTDATARALA